jgi:Abscisic acid G-protein coupled receptor/The Golgi pH Regulator (GPHR) Family N-terminal
MDVFLFGTSMSLSAYLPRFLFDSKTEQATMFLAMGLSLSLFSVAISEAVPKGTVVLLSERNISTAYWILLWLLSIHLLVVLPSLAGASVAESLGGLFGGDGKDDQKYPHFPWRRLPWWIRFTLGFFRILVRNAFHCCRFGFRYLTRRRGSIESSTLVMTIHDEEMVKIASSGSMETDVSPRSSKRGSVTISPRSITSNSNHNGKDAVRIQSHYSPRIRLLMVFGGICGIVSVMVTASWLAPLVVQPPTRPQDDTEQASTTTTLSLIVSWICAVGLLISALLNGFGSVSLPYANLGGLCLTPVRAETLTKLGGELRSMQEAMVKKRTTLRELTVEVSAAPRSSGVQTNRSSGTPTSNMNFSKLTQNGFSELGDELKNRRQILQTEIDFLEDLVKETQLDIEELKYSQSVAAAARTDVGKFKSLVGIFFSIVLLVRLFNAGYSIWSASHFLFNTDVVHKKVNGDIVTTVLLWLTGRNYVSHKRYNMLSQMVSLALTSFFSFTQVRTFLRTVTIVNRRWERFYKRFYCGQVGVSSGTSSNGGSNSGSTTIPSLTSGDTARGSVSFHSQLIAGFLGCYSLACIVLIKMMLPDEFSVAFSSALGQSDIFVLHAYVINIVFFSSAVISTVILGMLLGIQRQNNLRHAATTSLSPSEKAYLGPEV